MIDRLIDWSLDNPLLVAAIVVAVWAGMSLGFAVGISPLFALGFSAVSGISMFRLAFRSVRFYVEDRERRAYYQGQLDQMERDRIAEIYREKIRGAA